MTRPTALTTEDALELVFLAAVAHPERALRRRLAARLDGFVEAGQPLYTHAEVRDFLARQPGLADEPFILEPPALDLAVRLVRLVLAKRTPRHAESWVRLVGSVTRESDGGLLVSSSTLFGLQAEYLDRSTDLIRLNRQLRPYHLSAPLVRARLDDMKPDATAIAARCEAEDGFRLTIQGDCPWGRLDAKVIDNLQKHGALGSGRSLDALGLAVQADGKAVVVRTTTTESVIQFSACLARDEHLLLRRWRATAEGAVVVGLRDFEDDGADQPCVVLQPVRERWVRLPPCPPCRLDVAERLAICRWAYPPVAWLGRPLLDALLPRGPREDGDS